MKIAREQLASGQMVHRLIAEAARGITEAVFEACSHTDKFHAAWPEKYRKRFIQRYWPDYIAQARQSLLALLTPIPGTENDPDGPKYTTHELLRDQIFEALIIDGQYKAPAPLSTDQLRAQAGFEPLSEVLKAKHGAVLH